MVTEMVTRKAYGKTLAELAKKNKKTLVLGADLSGSTRIGEVKKVVSEQHFNFNIAEGNMMATATDMTTSGNIASVSTSAMFVAGRTSEQVHNSIRYPHLNVKVYAAYAGLIAGEDGASHRSVEDVVLMRGVPGMVVVSPAGGVETKATIRAVAEHDGPCYVCLGRTTVEDVYTEDTLNFQIEKENVIRKGNSVALIAAGITAGAAMKAADILKENGMDITVANVHTIKPADEELIVGLTEDHDLLVACEEYNVIDSLGSAVAEVPNQKAPKEPAMVGAKGTFGESGTPAASLEKYGPTTSDTVKVVEDNK